MSSSPSMVPSSAFFFSQGVTIFGNLKAVISPEAGSLRLGLDSVVVNTVFQDRLDHGPEVFRSGGVREVAAAADDEAAPLADGLTEVFDLLRASLRESRG